MAKQNQLDYGNLLRDILVHLENISDAISDRSTSSCDSSRSHRWRYKVSEWKGRKIKEPSALVPDQCYTIKELFQRSVINSMPDGLSRKYYAEDTNDVDKLFERSGIDLTTLDLTELDDYKEKLNQRIDDHRKKIKDLITPPEP